MTEQNYLELMLNSALTLHIVYSDEDKKRYIFQSIWIVKVIEQYGREKCQQELEKNIRKILERTKKQYEKYQKDMPLNDNYFQKHLSILEKILKEGGSVIVGNVCCEKVEIELKKI